MYIVGLLLVIAAYGVLFFLLWRMLPPLTAQNHWYSAPGGISFWCVPHWLFSHQSTLICERGSDECSLVHSYLFFKAEEKSEWFFWRLSR